MDPILNPYSPGAGMPPPELAGREDVLEKVDVALGRTRAGRPSKSVMLVGLRGVGKTVLLLRMRDQAEARGLLVTQVEAPESRSLPAMLAPGLRRVLVQLARRSKTRELSLRALRALAGFVGALKVTYHDIAVGLDMDPEPGLADNGDLELDLQELLETVGQACRGADTGLVMIVDELQYVAENELAALVVALHRTAQRQLPVVLVGAGLPQLRGRLGRAKSYAERLFDFPTVGPLSREAAAQAIAKPAAALGVDFVEDAVSMIFQESEGYPYFLQEWGRHVWNEADRSPIAPDDVAAAGSATMATLDESFFLVRFDRIDPVREALLARDGRARPRPASVVTSRRNWAVRSHRSVRCAHN